LYDALMRTTVTLDPDTEQLVRARMAERGVTFKQALNDLIREGVPAQRDRVAFTTRTASLGTPSVALDHALRLAADLEDEELVRKLRRRS
jgi:hypothetical protein